MQNATNKNKKIRSQQSTTYLL